MKETKVKKGTVITLDTSEKIRMSQGAITMLPAYEWLTRPSKINL